MEKNDKIYLGIFALFLLIFSIFSTKIGFHDSYEYINIAKNFAGINNVNLFSGHSLFYPFIISIFLKVWPSFFMLKLVNVFWVFLIGVALLLWLKNKTAFLLFAFSPLTWWVSIQTTPVLPASFFFLMSFIIYNKKHLQYRILYSGMLFGLSAVFYTPMLFLVIIFSLTYMWNDSFRHFLKYMVSFGIGFLPRLIQDFYLFGNPVYSIMRYAGNNLIVTIGLNTLTESVNILSNLWIVSIIFVMSPFVFRIYKIDFKKYKKHIIFLVVSLSILIIRVQKIKYFIVLSPILFLLLGKTLTKKEIKWNAIISIVIIGILTFGFFAINDEIKIRKDLEQINNEFDVDYIIAGPTEATVLAAFSWQNDPKYIWWQDYEASTKNEMTIREYSLGINPRIKLKSNLEIVAKFNRPDDIIYENYILVLRKDPNNFKGLEQFKLNKCFEELCVYEKSDAPFSSFQSTTSTT